MNDRRSDRPAPETMTPNTRRDETRRGPEPPPTQAEPDVMSRPAGATKTPHTNGESAMNQPRKDTGLSTADVASAMEQRDPSRDAGPKYVEGEERAARSTPLFPENQIEGFRGHWQQIQTGFVDEPRRSVEQAGHLVAEVMKRLADGFAQERGRLEQQWDRGDNINTEDLRVALQRYRSFFERLLSA